MEAFISNMIYEQNYELLKNISEKKYGENEDEKEEFIKKYHKKNYCKIKITKKNHIHEYIKKSAFIK